MVTFLTVTTPTSSSGLPTSCKTPPQLVNQRKGLTAVVPRWIYVDRRIDRMIDLRFDKESFFQRGEFPKTVINGTTEVVLENPWEGRPNSAPFDQQFYLIISLAVGGTPGWFPDDVGGKPWFDGSTSMLIRLLFVARQDANSAAPT